MAAATKDLHLNGNKKLAIAGFSVGGLILVIQLITAFGYSSPKEEIGKINVSISKIKEDLITINTNISQVPVLKSQIRTLENKQIDLLIRLGRLESKLEYTQKSIIKIEKQIDSLGSRK